MNNVVLVHGGFVDGSGWEGVYKTLTRNGYSVTVVQNPTMSLEDDVAYTKRALAAKDGPAILVDHSYGGAVITEAGNDPKVTGLVYITAFAPDKGESVATLMKDSPPGAPVPPIRPPQARERQRRRNRQFSQTRTGGVVVHSATTPQRLSHSIPAPFQPLHLALSNGSRQTRISSVLDFLTRCQLKLSDLDGLPSVH